MYLNKNQTVFNKWNENEKNCLLTAWEVMYHIIENGLLPKPVKMLIKTGFGTILMTFTCGLNNDLIKLICLLTSSMLMLFDFLTSYT